jgi:hypothetical protein
LHFYGGSLQKRNINAQDATIRFTKIRVNVLIVDNRLDWGEPISENIYYINTIIQKGFFDPEALKYAVMISVGSYLCLIIDKNKIYDALKIKTDLKFITIDEKDKKE